MTIGGVIRCIINWKILTSGILHLAVCITACSLSVFQLTVLKTFGWSSLKANLLTTPVRVVSRIISVCVGIWSDKVQRHGIFCVIGFSISIMGNLLVMLLKNGNLRYMGFYFASIGIYICQPQVIAWCTNQIVGTTKRGTLTAFVISCGQIGGIISALVFPSKDGPQYVPGILTCIASQGVGIMAAVNMWAHHAPLGRIAREIWGSATTADSFHKMTKGSWASCIPTSVTLSKGVLEVSPRRLPVLSYAGSVERGHLF